MTEIKNAFDDANESNDGFLKRNEFGAFVVEMNESAKRRYLKSREQITPEYVDMLW